MNYTWLYFATLQQKKEYLFQNNPLTAKHHLGACRFFSGKIFSSKIKVDVGVCSISNTGGWGKTDTP